MAKQFEMNVADAIRDKGATIKSQGTCYNCAQSSSCSCQKRFCPDIYYKYGTNTFVIDCKNYSSTTYISADDVRKLVRDKNGVGASNGYIVTTNGKISQDNLSTLRSNGCGFVTVGTVGAPGWKKKLYQGVGIMY